MPIYQRLSLNLYTAFALLAGTAYIAYLSLEPYRLSPHLWSITSFIGIALLLFTYQRCTRKKSRLSAKTVMIVAIFLHLIACLGQPFMEDDYFRYLWDGMRFYETGSPYGSAPADSFTDNNISPHFQQILDQINYPDIPTIYAPVLQYVFLLNHLLFPGDVNGLQILFSMFNLGLIALLLRHAQPQAAMLYAWNPLVLKEIAFTAHPDGLGALLLFAAALFLYKKQLFAAATLLALALASKIFALLLLPFFVFNSQPKHWLSFFGVFIAIYLPFIIHGSSDVLGLSAFAQDWQYNASLYALLHSALSSQTSKLILLALFSFGYFIYLYKYQQSSRQLPRMDIVIAAFLFISPVLNVWYWLWLLPFAVIYPSRWAWGSCALLSLAYWNGLYLELEDYHPYQQLSWVVWLQFSGIVLLMLWDCYNPWELNTKLKLLETNSSL